MKMVWLPFQKTTEDASKKETKRGRECVSDNADKSYGNPKNYAHVIG